MLMLGVFNFERDNTGLYFLCFYLSENHQPCLREEGALELIRIFSSNESALCLVNSASSSVKEIVK